MNTRDNPSTSSPAKRWIAAALAGAALAATGAAGVSMAADAPSMGMHGHGRHQVPADPAAAARHIDRMVEHIAGDGTPQQKARLAEIIKAAHADLQGTHAEFRAAHQKAQALLMQTAIDRVALEQLRAEQIARMDKVSKRLLTALEDAAEVLTPAQRVRFQQMMEKRMRH